MLKAYYDQIVGWFRGQGSPGDKDYIPAGPAESCHHFTIGKPGDVISGGLYIKIGTPIPEEIRIIMPYVAIKEEEKEDGHHYRIKAA
jgi:hypothetical protein